MNEFTLLTVLNSIKRHLLVSVALFLIAFWTLPYSDILDDRYKIQKTVIIGHGQLSNTGVYVPGYVIDYLSFIEIQAILSSVHTSVFLSNALGEGEVASFKLGMNKDNNIILVLKSHNSDILLNTANLILKRLQEFDELQIQKKISAINKFISDSHELIQLISLSDEKYTPSNAEIEQYASMQKIYDTAYKVDGVEDNTIESMNVGGIVRLKREEVFDKNRLIQQIFEIKNKIAFLELMQKTGFKKVSYFFPPSDKEVTKYFPNDMIFFGISLLVAFFYNLIMLNVLYIKYKRSA